MKLLEEIQCELLDAKSQIGPVLLKLRYLADRLGSDVLEEWVKFETEGYPEAAPLPDYRFAIVSYKGTFTNGFQTLNSVPIPTALVQEHAGEGWVRFPIQDSVSVIESLIDTTDPKDLHNFGVAASNLILLLQGKIYKGHSLISIDSKFGGSPFSNILHSFRAKVLDLTLALEKKVPIAKEVAIGGRNEVEMRDRENTTQITQTIIYGNQTTIGGHAHIGQLNVSFAVGDSSELAKWLQRQGMPETDAAELTRLASEEKPEPGQPLGKRARAWMGQRLKKGFSGAWDVGKDVAKGIIIAGLKHFYGLDQ
jgi:hypothetical protein